MEMTKFGELCTAYSKAQKDFENFKNECHGIAINLVKELKAYFQIPETQFSLYRIGEKNDFKLVPPAVISALTLRPDSMWQFGIGLTVCSAPETLPQELILIQILIRKDVDGNYFLKYGQKEEEHKIEKSQESGEWNFIPFFDYLHKTLISVYEDQIVEFISQDSRRTIGF